MGENRCNIHHRFAHRLGGVEFLFNTNKGNATVVQILNQRGKVADVTADPVEPVANYKVGLFQLDVPQHLLKLRSVCVFGRKAFILIHRDVGIGYI